MLTLNGRKSTIDEEIASREWGRRLPHMINYLRGINPAVVGGQEFTVNMCNDIMEAFPNLTYAGGVKYGNCPIFWNTNVLQAEEDTLLEKRYPSDQRERYMTLIRLQHRTLEWGGWFGSMHLAVEGAEERNANKLRALQISAIVADVQHWISTHPHAEDGKANLIMCGDLNDDQGDYAGVRKIAYDLAGWKPLRRRFKSQGDSTLAKFSGDTYRSANHWRKTSSLPRDSRMIDEIFTSGISLEDASLKRTCTDVWPIHVSDHNGIQADVVM